MQAEDVINMLKSYFEGRGAMLIVAHSNMVIPSEPVEFNLKELVDMLEPEDITTENLEDMKVHKWKVDKIYIHFLLKNNKIFKVILS